MPIVVEGPGRSVRYLFAVHPCRCREPELLNPATCVPEISAGADNGARIVWDHDGEEHLETVALGWTANTPTFAYRTRAGAASGALD